MSNVVIGPANDGSAVHVAVGDVVIVRLPENPTTGYRWSVERSAGLAPAGDEFSATSSAVGGGGERTLRFAARSPGTFRIEASLRREWEANVAPQAHLGVDIVVR